MLDKIETIENSLIQHGKENDSVYIINFDNSYHETVMSYVEELAEIHNYSKIIAKVPERLKDIFVNNHYEFEAYIPKLYNGNEDGYFLSKFLTIGRKIFHNKEDIINTTQFCLERGKKSEIAKLNKKFFIKKLNQEDINQMVKFGRVAFSNCQYFSFDADYILDKMNRNINYFGIFLDNKILSITSCELYLDNLNAEFSVVATLPEYRSNNFCCHLIKYMEKIAIEKEMKTGYSIVKANSTGANITLVKCRYDYGGTLINNDNICGNIETMNVWYKNLS